MRATMLTSEHEVRAGLCYLKSAYLCAIVNTITMCNDANKCIDLLRDPMYNLCITNRGKLNVTKQTTISS